MLKIIFPLVFFILLIHGTPLFLCWSFSPLFFCVFLMVCWVFFLHLLYMQFVLDWIQRRKTYACIWILFFQSGLVICYSSDCLSSYFSTRLCSYSYAFTNLTLKAETAWLPQGLIHKLSAVPSISHIPKWKSLHLRNWPVFTALGHWGLLTVISHLWQKSTDFLCAFIFFIYTAFQLCNVLNWNSYW